MTHPTKRVLIDTVISLLEVKGPDAIISDEVLHQSGVSRGSMYHHFEDFADLLESAQVKRFSNYVDDSILLLARLAASANSREELRSGLKEITKLTQSPDLAPRRFERIMPLSAASKNERLRCKLNAEQERLTRALMELVSECQARGFFSLDHTPRVIAVMIQAYTLGRIVDDVTNEKVDPAEWNAIVDSILDKVFGLDGISSNRNQPTE